MEQHAVYRELSKKLMLEHSKILPRIWESVCSLEETKLLDLMPGTAEDLAAKTGRDLAAVSAMCESLFHKGAAFEAVKDGRRIFRMPRHIIQFHDASILWREAPPEMIRLWVEFMDTEFQQIPELATAAGLPAFMRIIPIGESLETRTRILAYEDAARMIEEASAIAVVDCTCRKSHKHCDKPVEVCLLLNRGAEYTRKRGTGRMIDKKEAMAILRLSEDAGLVHATENKGGSLNVLCNCCTCCCEMMRFAKNDKTKGVIAPSRFLASVRADACTSCGACVDVCPMGSIALEGDGPARVDESCIGCGLCAHSCPAQAVILTETRPESFIPA